MKNAENLSFTEAKNSSAISFGAPVNDLSFKNFNETLQNLVTDLTQTSKQSSTQIAQLTGENSQLKAKYESLTDSNEILELNLGRKQSEINILQQQISKTLDILRATNEKLNNSIMVILLKKKVN